MSRTSRLARGSKAATFMRREELAGHPTHGIEARRMSGSFLGPASIPAFVAWYTSTNAANTLSTDAVAGTGLITQVGNNITGVGTAFVDEGRVGDVLSGTGIDGTVASITSDTAMTVTGGTGAGAGVAFNWNPQAGVSDRVTTLADLSGNGNSVSQATFAKMPSLTSAGAGLNGKRSLLLDGESDIMTAANFLSGTSGMVASVYQLAASIPNSAQLIFSSSDEATAGLYRVFTHSYVAGATPNPQVQQRANDTSDALRGGSTISGSTRYNTLWGSSGTAYFIRLNGVNETLTAASGTDSGDWCAETANRDNVALFARKETTEAGWFTGLWLATLVWDNPANYDYNGLWGAAITAWLAANY